MHNELEITYSADGDRVWLYHQLIQHFTEIYPVEQWKIKGFLSDSYLLDIAFYWMEFEPFEFWTFHLLYAGHNSHHLFTYRIP